MDKTCENCGYSDTNYCLICVDYDMHRTQEEKEQLDAMCDMMCGTIEED